MHLLLMLPDLLLVKLMWCLSSRLRLRQRYLRLPLITSDRRTRYPPMPIGRWRTTPSLPLALNEEMHDVLRLRRVALRVQGVRERLFVVHKCSPAVE